MLKSHLVLTHIALTRRTNVVVPKAEAIERPATLKLPTMKGGAASPKQDARTPAHLKLRSKLLCAEIGYATGCLMAETSREVAVARTLYRHKVVFRRLKANDLLSLAHFGA
jgi:hypothetical protein